MFEFLMGMADTGDTSKPWLIAVCMIVSIIVVVALFIIGNRGSGDTEDDNEGMF